MIKTSKQLKDLIRNLSKKNSADAQILLRNYMMERFHIYILSKVYQDTLNPNIFRQALTATSRKRQSEHMLLKGDKILREVEASPVMRRLWESYQKKFSYASDIEWSEVMSAARNLYEMTE